MQTINFLSNTAVQSSCWPDCVEDSFDRIVSHIVAIAEQPAECGATLMNAVADALPADVCLN
jgi:hypothetical protein